MKFDAPSMEAVGLKPGNWELVEKGSEMRRLPETKRDDIRSIIKLVAKEFRALSLENMNLKEKAILLYAETLLAALKKIDATFRTNIVAGLPVGREDQILDTLDRGVYPILLSDSENKRVVGISMLLRQAARDWKPRGLRDAIEGPPLTNTYELSGVYLLPEFRGASGALISGLIHSIRDKIVRDANNGYSLGGRPYYVYFDRPKSAPLASDDVLQRMKIQKDPAAIPDVGAVKFGYIRYAVKLEADTNGVKVVPWESVEVKETEKSAENI